MRRVDLLQYALEGARTRLSINLEWLEDWEISDLEADIDKIEREIASVKELEENEQKPHIREGD